MHAAAPSGATDGAREPMMTKEILIFSFADLVADPPRFMTLEPGDVMRSDAVARGSRRSMALLQPAGW